MVRTALFFESPRQRMVTKPVIANNQTRRPRPLVGYTFRAISHESIRHVYAKYWSKYCEFVHVMYPVQVQG